MNSSKQQRLKKLGVVKIEVMHILMSYFHICFCAHRKILGRDLKKNITTHKILESNYLGD